MRNLLIRLVRFYQRNISGRKVPCCRFDPVCSNYAIEALKIHGAFKGSMLAIYRVLRCSPLCKGGYDPVPPRKTKNRPSDKKIRPDGE
ncbi:MAG: membrane protein insertion efficiency factor YidD [Oscillospiraceae bacterium]|nr:membrane protein insertion efficiency factor YidD [Oscillospiraceae bacterium]